MNSLQLQERGLLQRMSIFSKKGHDKNIEREIETGKGKERDHINNNNNDVLIMNGNMKKKLDGYETINSTEPCT